MRGRVEFCPSALGTREAADLPRSTAKLQTQRNRVYQADVTRRLNTLVVRWGVDAFTQRRVSELRNEITALQDQSQNYRLQKRRTLAESDQQEVRRLRLLAIREELARMIETAQKGATDEADRS